MPYCQIITSQRLDPETVDAVAHSASSLVAEMLGKPESYVMVRVETERTLIFGGTTEPTCFVSLDSLGFPESETEKFSQIVCDFVHDRLDVPTDRIYIEFSSPDRHMWGFNRRTFG